MQFPETELIITDKNNVYHLDINEEHIADDILLVGDPRTCRANIQNVLKSRVQNTTPRVCYPYGYV